MWTSILAADISASCRRRVGELMTLDDYYTVQQAATRLGIHPESMRRLIRQDAVPFVWFGNMKLIPKGNLEAFARSYSPDHKTPKARANHKRKATLKDAIEQWQKKH